MTARFLLVALAALTASSALAQNCERAQGEALLEGAEVRALVFNNGALFWSGGDHVYEVPKNTGRQSIYSASLWLSGEVDGEMRFAGSDYGPYEFWPGPLGEDGGPPTAQTCAEHDRIWSVTIADVAAYNDTGLATDDLATWPAHLGAPVVDGDGDPDNYDLAGGDRPNVYGGHVLWWIMNDLGGRHDWSGRPGLGVEVRVTASAASEGIADLYPPGTPIADLVRYATHYRFEVVYRGSEMLEDVHAALFADADLGSASDDYVGTAPEARMAYTYNGDDFDEGSAGYGEDPPAVGLAAGRPSEGVVTRGSVVYKNNSTIGVGASITTVENIMRGMLSDGSGPWRVGGIGDGDGEPTDWIFPAIPTAFWSEWDLDGRGTRNTPADRRMMVAQGPYTLAPGEGFTFEVGIPWARAEGAGALGSARKLAAFVGRSAGALPVAPPADLATILPTDPRVGTGPTSVPPRGDPRQFALAPVPWPNPVRETLVVRYDAPSTAPVRLSVYDARGREVAAPLAGPATVGYNRVPVDVRGLAPGLYTYRLVANGRMLPTVGRFVVVH